MVLTLNLKAGEAKKVTFTVTDETGATVNLTSATCTFMVKRYKVDSVPAISKQNGSFDKAQAASGVVTLVLSTLDTSRPAGDYVGELRIEFSDDDIDKSEDIIVKITGSVTP